MRLILVLAMLALSACATRPPAVEARQNGALTGASFRLSGAAETLSPAEQLVAKALESRGLRRVGEDDPADYAVAVTYADRGRHVSAYVPVAAGDRVWLEHDARRWTLDKGAVTLGVRMVEVSTGREAYVGVVRQGYRKPANGAELPAMMDAALASFQTSRP